MSKQSDGLIKSKKEIHIYVPMYHELQNIQQKIENSVKNSPVKIPIISNNSIILNRHLSPDQLSIFHSQSSPKNKHSEIVKAISLKNIEFTDKMHENLSEKSILPNRIGRKDENLLSDRTKASIETNNISGKKYFEGDPNQYTMMVDNLRRKYLDGLNNFQQVKHLKKKKIIIKVENHRQYLSSNPIDKKKTRLKLLQRRTNKNDILGNSRSMSIHLESTRNYNSSIKNYVKLTDEKNDMSHEEPFVIKRQKLLKSPKKITETSLDQKNIGYNETMMNTIKKRVESDLKLSQKSTESKANSMLNSKKRIKATIYDPFIESEGFSEIKKQISDNKYQNLNQQNNKFTNLRDYQADQKVFWKNKAHFGTEIKVVDLGLEDKSIYQSHSNFRSPGTKIKNKKTSSIKANNKFILL